MKILILGSVALPVPPPMQGGTERIVYWQAVGLARRGHEVTLVAAHGSKADPAYALVEIGGGDTVAGSVLSSQPSSRDPALESVDRFRVKPGMTSEFTEGSRSLRKEMIYMAQVSQYLLDHGKECDVILNNMRGGESILLPVAKMIGKPFVTVMHLPIFDALSDLFKQYQTNVITISNAQREGFDGLTYIGTTYNATDLSELPFQKTAGTYLLMMGSIAPHKNQKDGILAAKKLGKPIVLAGKIGNQGYWDKEIAPLVDGVSVVHKGEMGIEEKAALLGGAEALLFPIVWPEPFGLVMIEAMATGTPVVAYRNGAVPEVVEEGKTGFVVDPTVDALVGGVQKIGSIDRTYCRAYVEAHFTVEKMIESLEAILQKLHN